MPFLALFTNLAFYHFSLLSFLLGAQIYQSFFANITAQQALTRSQFSILQAAIWPMYFKLQMIVSVLLALTYPGGVGDAAFFRGSASVQGLLDKDVRLTVLLPLASMFVFSVSNAFFWVPKTTSIMRKLHVETAREEKARGSTGSQPQDDKINSEQPSASAAPMTASSGLTTHSQHTALPLSNKNPPASLAPSTVSQWLPDQGSSVLESVQDRNAIQKDGEKSPKVKALSNQFLVFHGASYVCAMGTLAASGYYAMCIAQKYL